MKTIVPAIALACLVTASLARAQPPLSASEREIQALLDDEMVAANAHDADRFLTAYLHDSTFVMIFNGSVTQGFQAVRELQLKAWNNGATDVVYTQRAPVTYRELSPTVVLATMLLTSRRTLPTGEVRTGDLTVTMAWQKRPEGWRIVQLHESTVR